MAYVISHPNGSVPILINRTKVEQFIEDHFPNCNFGDTPENAIKHALYQALNTCSFGPDNTWAMAQRHEECLGVRPGNGSQASFDMDTFNNRVGISIGENSLYNCEEDKLIDAVVGAYNAGQLRKFDGTPTP